jgi:hypothetical protein
MHCLVLEGIAVQVLGREKSIQFFFDNFQNAVIEEHLLGDQCVDV